MLDNNFGIVNIFNYKDSIYNNIELISNDSINENIKENNKKDEFEFLLNEIKIDDNSINDKRRFIY